MDTVLNIIGEIQHGDIDIKDSGVRVLRQKRIYSSNYDTHCWKYYYIKYRLDYTMQNRQRLSISPINNE